MHLDCAVLRVLFVPLQIISLSAGLSVCSVYLSVHTNFHINTVFFNHDTPSGLHTLYLFYIFCLVPRLLLLIAKMPKTLESKTMQ